MVTYCYLLIFIPQFNLKKGAFFTEIIIFFPSTRILFIVHYHLVMTQRCNLQCTYCGATVEPELMPVNLDITPEQLNRFFSKDDEPPVIAFYGGEPTLEARKIEEIMDKVPAKAFMIQTNGTLLHRIKPEYIKRFHTILISIDGRPEITDYYRGKGTYQRALNGGIYARKNGFTGDLIARMTVSEKSDIYEEVLHLLNIKTPGFDHVHWQLDVMWDDDMNTRWKDFPGWLYNNYMPNLSKLIRYWITHLENNHEILGIAPFLGITHTLLTNKPAQLRCGAGIDFFAITTDGRITVCPIPPSIDFAVVGDIFTSTPKELPFKVTLGEPCLSCEERDVCGGRCLYTNKTKHWGEEGFKMVCDATKHLIKELRKNIPIIKNLIEDGIIKVQDFNYPVIPNGVEVIP